MVCQIFFLVIKSWTYTATECLFFFLSSLWKISREGELRLLSAEIDIIFFSSMLQRGPNPIFSPHVTQPNLCLQFDAHDSMNGVTGQKHMHGAPSNANWQGSHCLGLWESIIFMDVWAVYQWDMKQHCLNRSLHRSPVQCLIYCIPMLLAIFVNTQNIMEMTDCNT